MKKYFLLSALLLSFNLNAKESHIGENSIPGEFVWNELATTNVQGAKDFYGKVFGWEFAEQSANDMSHTVIKKGNEQFGGIWAISTAQQNQIAPHWLSYILVENIEDTLKTATQNGATVIKPIKKVGDMGYFAIIKDPVGAQVALWQSLKK